MKVRLYGFELEAEAKSVSIEDLMTYFTGRNGEPDNSGALERRIFVDSTTNKNYYLGLVVTVKDQKRFCRLEDSKGQIRITVENLTGSDKLMEFNFFVLNRKNGLGLYQHYHQSCGLTVFGGYLVSHYNAVRERLANNEIDEARRHEPSLSKSKERGIRKKHRGKLIFSQLVRKDSLEKMLLEFKKLKAFEYELSALGADVRAGIPLGQYVRKFREKLTFGRTWGVSVLAPAIAKAVTDLNPTNGRVHAVNELDEDVSLRIFNMPDNFGEEDFDEVALKLHNLDLKSFATHKVVKELVEHCESDELRHIFQAKVR